jgi:restriction system protein
MAALRLAEQAARNAEQAQRRAGRAADAQAQQAGREAQRLREEAMQADADARNATLADDADDLESMLTDGVEHSGQIDLSGLRPVAQHPAFARPELEQATPHPPRLPVAPEPVFQPPPPPSALFGAKKKHEKVLSAARGQFELQYEAWRAHATDVVRHQAQQDEQYRLREQGRLEELQRARAEHRQICEDIDSEVSEQARAFDRFRRELELGYAYAIEEYVDIVLSSAVYPRLFPIETEYDYDSELRELSLTLLVVDPSSLPTEREYKYIRARDEITASQLTKTDQRRRYNEAVERVALKTLHELFAADQRGWITTVALTVACDGLDPATGTGHRTKLLALGVDRQTFTAVNLAYVVPAATLAHLGALISKNPFELLPINETRGVRRR